MAQFLLVHCNRSRRVLIGGIDHAATGELIELPAGGMYTVTLRLEPGEFGTPAMHEVNLVNTGALNPREVSFVVG